MDNTFSYLPVMEFTRGDIVESTHFGSAVVVQADGKIVASYADPQAVTYLRSTSKPFQVLGLIENGGVEKFGLTQEEVAVMCGSHSGTPRHVEVVQSIHEKIGVQASDMLCGVHYPLDAEAAQELRDAHQEPTVHHHNCSGKHSGMLAYCKLMGWEIEDYINLNHPVQQAILKTFAEMVQLPAEAICLGIDGCSVPVFGIPMYNAAWGFARMADPEKAGLSDSLAEACVFVREAMMAFPEMVSGPKRFDTDLMHAGKGKIFSKGGAEGYQGIGIISSDDDMQGLGLALKISDGDLTERVKPAVSLNVLRSLKAMDEESFEKVVQYGPELQVKNWVKTVVGEGRPCFEIEFYES